MNDDREINQDILKLIKIDKNKALEEIFNIYYKRVYKFFFYRTGNKNHTEDLTSTVFEKIIDSIDDYVDRGKPLGSWIFTIARNTLYDFYRTDRSKDHYPIEDYEYRLEDRKDLEDGLIKEERNKQLMKSVSNLDKREQEIISLKFGAHFNNREIAKIMRLSESNVGTILYRSIKKLRKEGSDINEGE